MSSWSVDQVLALAPDAPSQKAARGLATPRKWLSVGHDPQRAVLWGRCQGSGSSAYQTCVDVTEPAYKCSCPSRKFPCKHALALLLLWAGGAVPESGEPPDWLLEWQAGRVARAAKAAARAAAPSTEDDPAAVERRAAAAEKTARRRADRVAGGVDELDRWLSDQIRQGLAGAVRAGYGHWDAMAARLVDAQAPGLAGGVRRLAAVAGSPDRLLAELSLLRLLISGYRRLGELPPGLAATVRSRVGFPVATDDVLAEPPVRDVWQVIGVRDEAEDTVTVRRVWLRGATTGRYALVLSFAAPGQALAVDLVLGTSVDADVCFYPGAQPLRAIVARRHPQPPTPPPWPAGDGVGGALAGYAAALAADPWLDRWPVVLREVCPARGGGWHLVDRAGEALPLAANLPEPWPLVAACGGAPATVAAEWGVAGLRPVTAWIGDRLVRL